ncbi:MAG: DoxX family membrane protein [Candidatus Taylorbacteria bacterium]|nr:DoxX family membrane protein [Candidatus Taylorbacteria bacterium]
MEYLFLLGRILFGGFFVMNAFNHFANFGGISRYAASKGVPASKLAVAVTGLLILLGGAGIILGYQVELAVLFLALFLLPVSFVMHAFWKVADPMQRMGEMVNFNKNIALLGAALAFLFIPEPWPLSI